jgi:hypothetical protein
MLVISVIWRTAADLATPFALLGEADNGRLILTSTFSIAFVISSIAGSALLSVGFEANGLDDRADGFDVGVDGSFFSVDATPMLFHAWIAVGLPNKVRLSVWAGPFGFERDGSGKDGWLADKLEGEPV